MSKGDPAALEQLAEWRRAGYGLWHVVFIIEGHDEQETIIMPGRMKPQYAIKYAIKECAQNLGTKKKWIHLKSLTKEG